MKIWLSKNSEVPVREQIVTQITLGIISGDLPTGKRLPSTKEISNRFGVHSNTVSAAYQKLAEQGWLEFKKGSGFYVREIKGTNLNADLKLEKLINEFLQKALKLGFSTAEVKQRLKKRFAARSSEKVFVVESDEALREIMVAEIEAANNEREIEPISFENYKLIHQKNEAVVAAMIDEKPKIESLPVSGNRFVYCNSRSVSSVMTGERRPTENDLIALVSGWNTFLQWSKTILLAANIEPDSLIVRSTKEKNWQSGLKSASMIICDSLTAKKLQDDPRVRVFQIIADESLAEIKRESVSR